MIERLGDDKLQFRYVKTNQKSVDLEIGKVDD
jgi:hypothetical protein